MAQYAELWEKIRAAGANVVAVAVDPPERSETVRRQLELPFAILCDVSRKIVRDWGVFEPEQMGGIAKPAVFIVDRDRRVKFASVDREAVRVPAATVVAMLTTRIQANQDRDEVKRRAILPRLSDWTRAIGNMLRFGLRSPKA